MRSRSIIDPTLNRRIVLAHLAIVFAVVGSMASAWGGDVANGHRLAERWCAACHATATEPTRFNRAQPFAAIAARQDISSDMIASFLLLPHATMPNLPL